MSAQVRGQVAHMARTKGLVLWTVLIWFLIGWFLFWSQWLVTWAVHTTEQTQFEKTVPHDLSLQTVEQVAATCPTTTNSNQFEFMGQVARTDFDFQTCAFTCKISFPHKESRAKKNVGSNRVLSLAWKPAIGGTACFGFGQKTSH